MRTISASRPRCRPAAALTGTINGICRLTGAHLQIAGAVGVNPANVVLTFSFSTQSTQSTRCSCSPSSHSRRRSPPTPLGVTVLEASGGLIPGPELDLYAGEITLPYYLSPPTAANPAAR
jgi:hypothetical protein